MGSNIQLIREERIARIVIDRPEKRNSLTDEMFLDLINLLEQLGADSKLCVLALEGTQGQFCSGRDVSSFHRLQKLATAYQVKEEFELPFKLFKLLKTFPLPTIAVVEGNASGLGAALASSCDIALADETAKFAYREIHLGLVPTLVSIDLLNDTTYKKAVELMLMGQTIDAGQAEKMGLITRAIPSDNFRAEVKRHIDALAGKPQATLRMIKEVITNLKNLHVDGAISFTKQMSAIATSSEAAKEGIASFLEKRKPNWY